MHPLHPVPVDFAPGPHHRFGAVPHQLANDPRVSSLHQRPGPSGGGIADQEPGQGRVGQVEALDQQGLTLAQANGMVDQDRGEGFPARIGHGCGS